MDECMEGGREHLDEKKSDQKSKRRLCLMKAPILQANISRVLQASVAKGARCEMK